MEMSKKEIATIVKQQRIFKEIASKGSIKQ
jgi:hypothetical protein